MNNTSVINKIIHADVLDGMALIPDNTISLLFSSPPYNVNIPYGEHKDSMPYDLYLKWLENICKEAYRVLRVGGRLAINIDSMVNHEETAIALSEEHERRQYFRPIVAHLQQIMEKIGFNYRCDIAWDKHQVVGRATAWGSYASCSNPIIRRRHEYILIWNKGPWRLDPPEKGIKSDLTGEEFQQWSMSYWPIPPETQNRGGHEVPFPVRLARRVIKMYCYPGDVVLDPFSGTGTTCLAAHLLKRRYIGIDNDAKFVEYAKNRIDEQSDMFDDDSYFVGVSEYA